MSTLYDKISPVMTSNTTPSPYVVSASTIYSTSYDAWKAFDSSTGEFCTVNNAVPQWLEIDLGVACKVDKYTIQATSVASSYNFYPSNFILQGSNDNSIWVNLDTQVGSSAHGSGELLSYVIEPSKVGAYRYYRLYMTAVTGNYIQFMDWSLYKARPVQEISVAGKKLSFGEIIYVDSSSGDDSTGDGSSLNPYKTFNKAYTVCSKAGTDTSCIKLDVGYYTCSVDDTIIQNVTVIGEGAETTLEFNHATRNIASGWGTNIYGLTNVWFIDFVFSYIRNNANYAFIFQGTSTFDNIAVYTGLVTNDYGMFSYVGTLYMNNCTDLTGLKRSGTSIITKNCYGVFNEGTGNGNAYSHTTTTTGVTPSVGAFKELLSGTWQNIGTGLNPDGTQANLGVYGGAYAWDMAKLNNYTPLSLANGVGVNGATVYTAPNGIKVTASTANYNNGTYYYLKYLFDGSKNSSDGGTYWLTNSSGNQTLTFDLNTLPAGNTIGQINVYPKTRADASSNFRILESSNNVDFTEVIPWIASSTSTAFGHLDSFFPRLTKRYVRFELTQNNSIGVTLNEIEFMTHGGASTTEIPSSISVRSPYMNDYVSSDPLLTSYDKIIYVDATIGNDTSGTGSKEFPFATTEKAYSTLVAGYSYGIVLGEGSYYYGAFTQQTPANKVVALIGKSEKTVLKVKDYIYNNNSYSSNPCKCECHFYKLVWDGNGIITYNCHSPVTTWRFYNVVFRNIANESYAYFLPYKPMYLYNCVKVTTSTCFFRTTATSISLYNSYGGFTSGYGTSDASWNTANNIITGTPSVDTVTYAITADKSIWEHKATGFTNPDYKVANIGVYGGQYAWGDWGAYTYNIPTDVHVRYRTDIPSSLSVYHQSGNAYVGAALPDLTKFNKVWYVDATRGNDTTGDGTFANPLASVLTAIDKCANSNDAVYALAGTYDVTNMTVFDNYDAGGLYDKGKNIVFIGEANKTVFVTDGVKNTSPYHHCLQFSGGSSVYDIIFNHKVGTRTTNYTVAFFCYSYARKFYGSAYNCVFNYIGGGSPSMCYGNSYPVGITLNNCTFNVPVNFTSSYSGAGGMVAINCVSNKAFYAEGTNTSYLNNVTLDSNYAVTSTGWANTGTGQNPDGTKASLGVYGGTYAWGYTLTRSNDNRKVFLTVTGNTGVNIPTNIIVDNHNTDNVSYIENTKEDFSRGSLVNVAPESSDTLELLTSTVVAFDGTNSYGSLPINTYTNLGFGSADFTVETRFKVPSVQAIPTTVDYHVLVERWNSAFKPYSIGVYDSTHPTYANQVVFYRKDNSGVNENYLFSGISVNDGKWHTATAVKRADYLYLYVDGALVSKQQDKCNVTNASNDYLFIGTHYNTTVGRLTGSIDFVRMYNSAKSVNTILSEYAIENPDNKTNMTCLYTFEDAQFDGMFGSLNIVDRLHPTVPYIGTLTAPSYRGWHVDPLTGYRISEPINLRNVKNVRGSKIEWVADELNAYYNKLDTNYITVPNSPSHPTSKGTFQIDFCCNDTTGSSWRSLISKWYVASIILSDGTLYIYNWANNAYISTGYNPCDGIWHNIALVYEHGVTNGTKLYVDGELLASYTTNPLNTSYYANPIYIGATSPNSQMANAMLREAKFYNRALSQSEVRQNRSALAITDGLAGYLKLNEPTGTSFVDSATISNGTLTGVRTPMYDSHVKIETSIDGGITWAECVNGGEIPNIAIGDNLTGKELLLRETLSAIAFNTDPPRLRSLKLSVDVPSNDVVTYIASTRSMGGATTEKVGTTALRLTPSDFVNIASDNSFNAYPMTMDIRVRLEQKDVDKGWYVPLISKYVSTSYYRLDVFDGKVGIFYHRDAGTNYVSADYAGYTGKAIDDGEFHDISATIDATGAKIYVDGVLVNSGTWVGTAGVMGANTANLCVNKLTTGTKLFQSYITVDQLRLWNISMTQQQVNLYRSKIITRDEPNLIAGWLFNEGAGSTLTSTPFTVPYFADKLFTGSIVGVPQWITTDIYETYTAATLGTKITVPTVYDLPSSIAVYSNSSNTFERNKLEIDLVPPMASNNTVSTLSPEYLGIPAPTTFASSSYSTAYDPYKAFNDVIAQNDDGWHGAYLGYPYWLGVDFGATCKVLVEKFVLWARYTSPQNPSGWFLQGSDDGTTWNNIQQYSNITSWTTQERKVFTVDKPQAFRYFRLYFYASASGAIYCSLGEVEFLGQRLYHGSNVKTFVSVKKSSDIPSSIFVRPHAQAVGIGTIVQVYTQDLPTTISTFKNDFKVTTIMIRPHGSMTGIVNIMPKPTKTQNVYPLIDAFVRNAIPRVNYGSESDVYVGKSTDTGELYRGLVEFDISKLPSNITIKKATLKLYVTDDSPAKNIGLYVIENPWTEYGVTWANQPTAITEIMQGQLSENLGYDEYDITDITTKWYTGAATNYGFLVKALDESEGGYKRFFSKESGQYTPVIEVEYVDNTVYSYAYYDIETRMSVRRSSYSSKPVSISIVNKNRTDSKVTTITVNRRDQVVTKLGASKPEIPASIKIRQFGSSNKPVTISVRVKGLPEDKNVYIGVNKTDVITVITIRKGVASDKVTTISVRRSDLSEKQTYVRANRPEIVTTIGVLYSSAIPTTIFVGKQDTSDIATTISSRLSSQIDKPVTLSVWHTDDVPAEIKINSQYLRTTISVGYGSNIPTVITVGNFSYLPTTIKVARTTNSDKPTTIKVVYHNDIPTSISTFKYSDRSITISVRVKAVDDIPTTISVFKIVTSRPYVFIM